MQELFGVSMNLLMVIFLAIVLVILGVVSVMAWRNRIMLKLGLRNIPRRRAQTILIIVGSMLSAVIIAAAFGTGDTISFSIRKVTLEGLGTIDEFLTSTRDSGQFGSGAPAFFPRSQFDDLQRELANFDAIDGMVPYIGETVPSLNLRTSLTEGQTRIVAVDPDLLQGFGEFALVSGVSSSLKDLSDDGVLVNEEAVEQLDARVGDRVKLFLEDREIEYQVEGIVEDGGLAGADSTILMPLERGQVIFNRPGQINFIAVSNKGDEVSGEDFSEDVATRLRVIFADPRVAEELKLLLNREDVLGLLEQREADLSGNLQADMRELREGLQRPAITDGLIRVLADSDVQEEALDVLEGGGLAQLEGEADTLFGNLSEIRVFEIKRFFLELADEVSSQVTAFFLVLGLFSVMVGILLIFLIFVMLAAARRTEMGMTRALGAKRSHLVQMFVFEGTAYDLVAAAVGTSIGLGVAIGIMAIANQIIGSTDDNFRFTYHIEPRSAIVAYCLGMIITFITVAVSAYRVSRMNIVEAVRGLPETIVISGEESFSQRLLMVGRALIRPLLFLVRFFINIGRKRVSAALLPLGGVALWALVLPWIADVFVALLRFSWPYFRRGWLTFLLGSLLMFLGAGPWDQTAPFVIGVSFMIIGLGLMLRLMATRWPSTAVVMGILTAVGGVVVLAHGIVSETVASSMIAIALVLIGAAMTLPLVLGRTDTRPELIDRLAFTFIGIVMLAWWVLPFDTLEPVIGRLESDIEMFFVSGIAMVAAAVWTVMYNADLLLRAITFLTSGIGKLRPVLVTAVAYPMSAKFRTGLTLAMFALVIFTLIVMSILTNAFSNAFADTDEVTGHWDIEAIVTPNNPIGDIRAAIEDKPNLALSDFEAIGGYVTAPVRARQPGAESQRWESFSLQAADEDFLDATEYDFKIIADGFGPTKAEVWQALRLDPSLAVIDSSAVPSAEGDDFEEGFGSFEVEGLFIEDETMSPIEIEVLETRTDKRLSYTIIGVLEIVTDNPGGLVTSKASVDQAFPFPIPLTTYRFRTAEGVDVKGTSRRLEASFLENGMESEVLEEVIDEQIAVNRAFNNLLTGFMGMGLVVGIAALGVISLRAVVERRQQIGVLRAIGYRQSMIQLMFLLESSFVALLGVAIGVALGTIVSFNLVKDFQDELEGIRFTVPWVQIIIIIAIAYVFSMLATYLPARQAGRIHPAEALRYE